jgi:hypothetical protein
MVGISRANTDADFIFITGFHSFVSGAQALHPDKRNPRVKGAKKIHRRREMTSRV